MVLLFVPRREAQDFTWTGNVGVAEVSDFGPGEIGGRVYDDACDYGFDLRSRRTGVTLLMTEAGVEHDCEGDVIAWKFRATKRVLETHGRRTLSDHAVPKIEIHVLND